MTTVTALDQIDLTDLDRWVEGVPYEWFALMRQLAPLHWQDERDGRGFWSFTLYDDIVAVSRLFPDMQFVVFHGAWDADHREGPYAPSARKPSSWLRHIW